MNFKASIKKLGMCCQAMGFGVRYPTLLKQSLKRAYECLHTEGLVRKNRAIKEISLKQIASLEKEIRLLNGDTRDGNVTPYELMVISQLVVHYAPKTLLEIGTFDGNTLLQMALNAPVEAILHSIDLPNENICTQFPILQGELKFVTDREKGRKKYMGTGVEHKIIQHFGDSTTYDFSRFGRIDFCFIDGGHSYECVKSDTEKVMNILSPEGVVLWHDFSPLCPGVFRYLQELANHHHIAKIAGTSLAFLKRNTH